MAVSSRQYCPSATSGPKSAPNLSSTVGSWEPPARSIRANITRFATSSTYVANGVRSAPGSVHLELSKVGPPRPYRA